MSALDARAIEATMERILDGLTRPRSFILFGGCAMCVDGIKGGTIDIDLIVRPHTEYAALIADLYRAGFVYLKNEAMDEIEPQDERPRLDALERWFTDDAPQQYLDLFPAHAVWHKGLQFSPEMQERARHWIARGASEARIADPSTIFLLKSITGRWRRDPRRDLPDLEMLHATGRLDWAFIAAEWYRQKDRLPQSAVACAREAIAHLRERIGRIPWSP